MSPLDDYDVVLKSSAFVSVRTTYAYIIFCYYIKVVILSYLNGKKQMLLSAHQMCIRHILTS